MPNKIILQVLSLTFMLLSCSSSPIKNNIIQSEFIQNSGAYTQNNALHAARVASGTNEDKIELLIKDGCYDFLSYSKADTDVVIMSESNYNFIAFSGTNSFSDIYQDIKINPRSTTMNKNPGKYEYIPAGHSGFRRVTAEIIGKDFFTTVKASKCFNSSSPTFLAGHSLGAAVALMMVQPFDKKANIDVSGVYLFAPPLALNKVGEASYDIYKNKIINFVNYKDYVARGGYRGTYHHVGRYYSFDESGILKSQEPKYYKYSLWEKITFRAFNDHYLDAYIKNLSKPENEESLVRKRSE